MNPSSSEKHTPRKAFTLVELLLVMAILAVLASVTVTVLRPQEYLRRTKDSRRIQDMRLLADGLNVVRATQTNPTFGTSSIVYVSIPDSSPTCANLTLPDLPTGWSYACAPQSTYRNIDGTGWIPVDFTPSPGVQFSTLPIDDENSDTNGLYYTYVASSTDYAVASLLASDKRLQEAALPDGGSDPARFEAGSDLSLWTQATGLVGWWPLDGNTNDMSGNNNHGTNNGATATSSCKVGDCYDFERSDSDYINVGSIDVNDFTILAWIKLETIGWYGVLERWGNSGDYGYSLGVHDGSESPQVCRSTDGTFAHCNWNNTPLTVGNWRHAGGVYDAGYLSMFTDGQIEGSPSWVGAGDAHDPPTQEGLIGASNSVSPTYFFEGIIDDVRLYTRALSDFEIQAIYNAQK